MQEEKIIKLGHSSRKNEIERMPQVPEYLTNKWLPRIPVFGFASQQTPDELIAGGYIPSSDLIEYWKGSNWTKAENKEHLKGV